MAKSECKILTYNIFHDLPVYRRLDQRLELLAAEIAAERPHLVALQEVACGSGCGDIGARLCALVNSLSGPPLYRLDYMRADSVGEGAFVFQDGVALMSNLAACAAPATIKFDAQVRLGGEFGGHYYRLPDDRVAMVARYRLNDRGAELQACVTHLTDRRETIADLPVRLMQARELVRWLQLTCDPAVPLVLAGDFNDVPDSETIAAITGAGFLDLWNAAGVGPGYTNDHGDIDLESERGSFNQRIDYLFLRPGIAPDFDIVETRLFLDRPRHSSDGGWLWGSDHLGVIARLSF